MQFNGPVGTPITQKRPSPRQSLVNLGTNAGGGSGFAGYGMSAGMKVSNRASAAANGTSRPLVRSRGTSVAHLTLSSCLAHVLIVAQRPVPGFPVSRDSTFAPPQAPNMFSNGTGPY
jgi:E3 ubiquitin-protein ligase CCNP1IP1